LLYYSAMKSDDRLIDKTTIIKSNEPIKLKAVPFAKGYRVQVEAAFDPDNTIHLDRFAVRDNDYHKAIENFVENTIKKTLHSKLIVDDED